MANNTGRKYGGRKKGTQNKITSDLREAITDFVKDNLPNIQKKFDSLEDKEQLIFLDKMLKYCLPTLQAIDTTPNLTDEQLEMLFQKLKNELQNEG